MTANSDRVIVTGGAGYIGTAVVASLLAAGRHVTVLDNLSLGADALLAFRQFEGFRLERADVSTDDLDGSVAGASAVVHLAALVGYPACNRAGRQKTWDVNVTGTERVYEAARRTGVERIVFASSYSNYGRVDGDRPVTEESPLQPQSTYAESKVEAEHFLLRQSGGPAPVCLRLATVFGLSPRTRFDLMVNQFVLDAYTTGRLVLYQEDFKRSFVHVDDVSHAIATVIDVPVDRVRGQVFNVGSESLNTTKAHLVELVRARWPALEVETRALDFAGDMRSIHVSYEKIRRVLGFATRYTLEDGIAELGWALEHGVISDPASARYRNHPAIVV